MTDLSTPVSCTKWAFVAACLLTVLAGPLAGQQQAAPAPASGPALTSAGVRFSFRAPGGTRRVFLAGDFNAWGHNRQGRVDYPDALMSRDDDGVWALTLPIAADLAKYKFVIENADGQHWVADPTVADADRDGNSILVLARAGGALTPLGSTALIDIAADAASGRISVLFRNGAGRGSVRDAISLPPALLDGVPQSGFQPEGNAVLRNGALDIRTEALGDRALAITYVACDGRRHAISIPIKDNSRYFGSGERFHALDQKGYILPMTSLDRPEDKGTASYKPVPFVMSSRGYAVWVDSFSPGRFDLNATDREVVSLDYTASTLRVVVIAGPLMADMLAEFTRLTGRPPVPPAWSFAPWKSRDVHRSREEVIADAELTRWHRLPGSVLVIDSPWETSYNDFTLNRGQFADPEAMFARVHELGFVPCFWLTPFINSRNATDMKGVAPGPSANFAEAEAGGFLVKAADGKPLIVPWWKGEGALVDFTNPDATAWWHTQLEKMLPWGVAALKCDDGEGTFVKDAVFADRTPAADMKARYATLYLKAAEAFLEKHRPGDHVLLSRAGFTGTGAIPFGWAGDNEATWSPENGLPGVILAAQNAALSGHPLWGCDTAGYIGEASPELFIRWTQFAAFTPLMQVHMQSNKGPWDFGPQALDIYRSFARLHTDLYPYIAEAAHDASERGLPIIRPMVLAFERDPQAAQHRDQYLFGPDLFVAPMDRPGTQRPVYLPRGQWTDYWTGERFTGPRTVIAEAPLERIPLYVRENAAIPMLPGDTDTLLPRTPGFSPDVKCLDDRRVVEIWPGDSAGLRSHEGITVTSESDAKEVRYTIRTSPPRPLTIRMAFQSANRVTTDTPGATITDTARGAEASFPDPTAQIRLKVARKTQTP